MGKKWNDGLDTVLARIGWAYPRKGSLFPFAIAAHSCNDLNTVFELLQFDASVLSKTRERCCSSKEKEG